MPDLDSLHITQLSSDQEVVGLRLILEGLPESEFQQQVNMLRAWAERQPLAGYLVWGAFRLEKLAGAMLVQLQPGRTAVVWPPRLVAGEPQETARQLLQTGLVKLEGSGSRSKDDEVRPKPGIRMIQALVPTEDGTDADLLSAAGFRHVSDLLFLVCRSEGFPPTAQCPELQFEPYSTVPHARFAQLVDATYKDTLDCPAVNGVRSVDNVLQGYQATGQFDPERWFIVRHQGEDVGCLILTDYAELATWELIYFGLVPTARGRSWGLRVVRHAMWLCGQAARNRLILAVDAANEPALRIYAAAGFQSWDQKSVYVLVLDEKNG